MDNWILITLLTTFIVLLCVGIYFKRKLIIIISSVILTIIILYYIYSLKSKKADLIEFYYPVKRYNSLKTKTQSKLKFKFLNDAANVTAHPETYCGTEANIPIEYDQMGTRHGCLKKGIGIGMAMPDAEVNAALARAANRPPYDPAQRVYCGNANVAPPGYAGIGTINQCLKSGVGAGMRMPQARRHAFQNRPPRPLGKKEIMNLAKRVGITTHDRSRHTTIMHVIARIGAQ